MAEKSGALDKYIKEGISRKNSVKDLRINAIKKGYKPNEVNAALARNRAYKIPQDPQLDGKKHHKFFLPKAFTFPLSWTLFFAIVGIIIQSIVAHRFVFIEFFGSNFVNWLYSFKLFTDTTQYANINDLILTFVKTWYYFAFAGGLLSLIWVVISWSLTKASKDDKG
jgi:hypothetical protein